MTQTPLSTLLEFYEREAKITRESPTDKNAALKARKEAVLSELESAHLLIYQQMAQRAIKAGIGREKSEMKSLEKDIINMEEISHITNTEYFSKSLYPKPTLQEDSTTVVAAFDWAQKAVRQDEALKRFRRRVNSLEANGQTKDLEAILTATHETSVKIGVSAKDFLTTFDAIPEQDQVAYANATTNMLKDLIVGEWNPLFSRLQAISPKQTKDRFEEDHFIKTMIYKEEKYEDIKKVIFSERQENHYLINTRINERPAILMFQEPSLERLLAEKLKLYSKDPSPKIPRKNGDFFGEVLRIYQQLGAEVGSNWLREANALFRVNLKQGEYFVTKSRPALTSYCKDLGWDFETFMRDYNSFGKPIFEVADVTAKFQAFNQKRKRELVRHLVDLKDEVAIKELKGSTLPEPELVEARLPKETSVQDLIASVKRTSKLYEMCRNSEVDPRLVSHRLRRAQRMESVDDYLRTLESIEGQAKEFIAFADEQRKNPNMNLGFDEFRSQETLEVYQEVLGKSFAQFKRDFEATGAGLQKIPEIVRMYEEFLGRERLKTILNYVVKQRSRDLIDDLVDPAPMSFIETSLAKLGQEGKENTVKAIKELNKTWRFLVDVKASQILWERLSSLPDSSGEKAVTDAITGSKRQCYSVITDGAEVPTGLERMVDNALIAYYKDTGKTEKVFIQPALKLIVSTYLKAGPEAAFKAIRELEPNKTLANKLRENGVDVDAFRTGISQSYHVSTDEGSLQRINERINAEFDQVWDRLSRLYTSEDRKNELDEEEKEVQEKLKSEIEQLKQGSLREQLNRVDKFLASHEFNEKTRPLKSEVKGHVQTARSLSGSLKEMDADVSFYVSTDPLESLHMGQYFSSCLSLSKNHGGCNGWAAVVQTMDINKNVIYAKTEDGRYIGRNRTALTDKGVLCTRFYQNGDMNLNNSWLDYLGKFADYMRQDVMIPTTFTSVSMSSILEKMVAEGKASKEKRTVNIAPAYYTAFYGDGLSTKKSAEGIEIETDVYVLRPKTQKLDSEKVSIGREI